MGEPESLGQQSQRPEQGWHGRQGRQPGDGFEAHARNPAKHVDEVLDAMRCQNAPTRRLPLMLPSHYSQQGPRPEQNGLEHQRSHTAQESQDPLYPNMQVFQRMHGMGKLNSFTQQAHQVEQGSRRQQGRQSGPRNEAHPRNENPSVHVDDASHGTVGPVSLGRQGGLLQQKTVDSQAPQSPQGWVGQHVYLSKDWFDPPAYTKNLPQKFHQVLRAMRGQDASIQQVPSMVQDHIDRRGGQSAQRRPGQPSSRTRNRDRGQPTSGSRSDHGMHGFIGQDQVTFQSRVSQQTRDSRPYVLGLPISQAGHQDQGYPHSSSRGIYGTGGEVPITPPQQVVPPVEAMQRHNPMSNQHFTPHNQQPRQEPLGQSNSPFPEARRKPGKWECPTCWEQLMTEVSFKRHMGRHLSQGR